MKKRFAKLSALAAIFCGIFQLPLTASATSMDSNIGITFTSPGKVLPGTGGKLPNTGEVTLSLLFLIGLALVAFVLYRWWKRRSA
ncbi:LPXTG cell wall anchor domain-containing protein [Enterococcus sp. LJL120]